MPELKHPVKVVAKLAPLRTFKHENHDRPHRDEGKLAQLAHARHPRNLG
jgi:hypothetical protein